jgi:chromate transporter
LFAKVERSGGAWFRPWLPEWAGLDWMALALSIVAAVALLRFHLGIVKTLAISAVLGMVWRLV